MYLYSFTCILLNMYVINSQYVYSKGTVLEKTVEYVREIYIKNEQLTATAKLAEKSANALQVLQNQISVLEKENAFLRAQMIQLGIDNTSGAISARTLFANPLTQSLLSSAQVQPSPPPPPPPVPNTTQLLVSLAQTLTSNPLLASLAQQSVPQPSSIPPSISTNDTQVYYSVFLSSQYVTIPEKKLCLQVKHLHVPLKAHYSAILCKMVTRYL